MSDTCGCAEHTRARACACAWARARVRVCTVGALSPPVPLAGRHPRQHGRGPARHRRCIGSRTAPLRRPDRPQQCCSSLKPLRSPPPRLRIIWMLLPCDRSAAGFRSVCVLNKIPVRLQTDTVAAVAPVVGYSPPPPPFPLPAPPPPLRASQEACERLLRCLFLLFHPTPSLPSPPSPQACNQCLLCASNSDGMPQESPRVRMCTSCGRVAPTLVNV